MVVQKFAQVYTNVAASCCSSQSGRDIGRQSVALVRFRPEFSLPIHTPRKWYESCPENYIRTVMTPVVFTMFRMLCALLALSLLEIPGSVALESRSASHWASVRGHVLYYETHGAGHPLLLLHGGGATVSESFSRQLDALAADHQIIAPEQVGQGHSPDIPGPLSYSEMMRDTAALLEQMHVTNVDVVGWSDGGIVALMLAANYPQLVRRIVVSGVNIAPDGLEESEFAQTQAALGAQKSSTDIAAKLNRLWLTAPTADELNTDLLREIHQKVLVLAGDRDVIKLDHTLLIYRSLPQAQLSILPDTGHATFAQRPEWINPLILQFLAQG